MISVLKDSVVNNRQNAEEIPISFGNLIKNEKGKEPYESMYHMREPMSIVSTLVTSCPQVIKERVGISQLPFLLQICYNKIIHQKM